MQTVPCGGGEYREASSWNLFVAGGGGPDGGKGKTGRAGVDGRGGVDSSPTLGRREGVLGRGGVAGRGSAAGRGAGATSCTGASLSSRSRVACCADAELCVGTTALDEDAAAACRRLPSGDRCERSGIFSGAEVPKVNSCAQSSSPSPLAKQGDRERAPAPFAEPGREDGREPGREPAAPPSPALRLGAGALGAAAPPARGASGGSAAGRVVPKENSLLAVLEPKVPSKRSSTSAAGLAAPPSPRLGGLDASSAASLPALVDVSVSAPRESASLRICAGGCQAPPLGPPPSGSKLPPPGHGP
mmetsp:Transcript_13087/g.37332  ORF Transcript_13087/g.37332 Transcript_13087/m.37332 type:complete len:302 (-) Transcript_13087:221-1126(-)